MGSSRVSNFSDLIQRATANCLLHPLGSNRFQLNSSGEEEGGGSEEEESGGEDVLRERGRGEEQIDKKENGDDKLNCNNNSAWDLKKGGNAIGGGEKEVEELVALISRVFDSVSTIKRVYAELQAAHSPWDPARMRAADEAMVSELRRIGVLRERFKRRNRGFKVDKVPAAETLREVVAPYEAAVEEMRKEVKVKEEEMDVLKQRLNRLSTTTTSVGRNGVGGGRGPQSKSKRKAAANIIQAQGPLSPSPELFESTVIQVRKATKSFSSLLLSLMRSARWDISAAVRSIVAAASPQAPTAAAAAAAEIGGTSGQPHHARYALESYVTGKLFQGFDHESFYIDGTLQSLLDPANFRRDCFSKYRDMRSMDPTELLGVTPTCHFGAFCAKKYLAILHPKMEESLLGDLDHRNRVSAGDHPRTDFYAHFLAAAKAVWLLHLLAFALDPVPGLFEAAPGAEFCPEYMESVVRFPAAGNKLLPALLVVGLPVSPGFKLGNGSVIKARVFLVNRS